MQYSQPPKNLPVLPRLCLYEPNQGDINEFRTVLELDGKDTSNYSDNELKNIILSLITLNLILRPK